MHIENAQNDPIHAPKTANVNEKLDSSQLPKGSELEEPEKIAE